MSEKNGSRIIGLSGMDTHDVHGRQLKHNATIEEVYQIVAEETAKVHEWYLRQIPVFVARMIQDALVSYGLVVIPATVETPAVPENTVEYPQVQDTIASEVPTEPLP